MNRRDLLRLSMMSALSTTVLSAGPAKPLSKKTATGSAKKGIGLSLKAPNRDNLLKELNCKWTYSWTAGAPERPDRNIPHVPMVWGTRDDDSAIAAAARAAKRERIGEMLGFNEPDRKDQANMTVEAALALWPTLEKTKLRLGSPGCGNPESEWMQEFMKAAKGKKLKVDFVCVHSYGGDDPNKFLDKLNRIHTLYDKPIWITEFAVADWNAHVTGKNNYPPESVLKFMEAVLPRLDKLDFIERYAWFPCAIKGSIMGPSALYDEEGKLTRVGECYRDA